MAAIASITDSLRGRRYWRDSMPVRLAGNTLWSIAGSASTQGSSLLAAVVVARMLGLTEFGKLALLQATVLMIGTLGEMGLSLTATRFVSRWRTTAPERSGRLMGTSLVVAAVSAVVLGAMLAGIAPLFRISMLERSGSVLWAASGLLLFDMLNRVQMGSLAGLEAFRSSAEVQLCRGLLTLPFVWIGAHTGGLAGAIFGLFFVSFTTFVIAHWTLRRKCRSLAIPLRFRGKIEPEILSTSMALWAGMLLLTGSAWAVAAMLSRQGGFSELALFHAADRWKTALLFLPQTLFQVTLPMISHSEGTGDRSAGARIFSLSLASSVAVTIVGAGLIWSLSDTLMSTYGPGFQGGGSVLAVAAPVAVVSAVYTIGSSALWAFGKSGQMLAIDFLKTVLLLGVCFGFAATAWSVMLAYLLAFSIGSTAVLLAVRRQFGLGQEGTR